MFPAISAIAIKNHRASLGGRFCFFVNYLSSTMPLLQLKPEFKSKIFQAQGLTLCTKCDRRQPAHAVKVTHFSESITMKTAQLYCQQCFEQIQKQVKADEESSKTAWRWIYDYLDEHGPTRSSVLKQRSMHSIGTIQSALHILKKKELIAKDGKYYHLTGKIPAPTSHDQLGCSQAETMIRLQNVMKNDFLTIHDISDRLAEVYDTHWSLNYMRKVINRLVSEGIIEEPRQRRGRFLLYRFRSSYPASTNR